MSKSLKWLKVMAMVIIPIAIFIVAAAIVLHTVPSVKYSVAVKLYENGRYEKAFDLFISLGGYENVKEYVSNYQIFCEKEIEKGSTRTYTTTYTYDSEGNLVREEGNKSTKTFTYDYTGKKIGMVNSHTSGSVHVYTYNYDSAGNMVKVKKDGEVTQSYAYDARGNLIKEEYDTATVIYAYDENNRMMELVWTNNYKDEIRHTYTYNEKDRLEKEEVFHYDGGIYSGSNTYTYFYDDNGHLVKKVNEGEYDITYSYDDNGYLVKEVSTQKGDLSYVYTCTYDAFGNKTQEEKVYGNGETYITEYHYCGIYQPNN